MATIMAARTAPPAEMTHKERPTSLFAAPPIQRPVSTFTDLDDDSDWEDGSSDGSGSEFEEDEASPRGSFDTMTTVDEAPTPRTSSKDFFAHVQRPSISGPVGPHLFRISFDSPEHASILSPFVADNALQMSPLVEKHILPSTQEVVDSPVELELELEQNRFPTPPKAVKQQQQEQPKTQEDVIKAWNTSQVAAWMFDAGFEPSVIDKFEDNDVTGAVLLDMKFEHLKELGLVSFGQRHEVWTALAALRGDEVTSPAVTDIEDGTSRQPFESRQDHTQADCIDTPITPGTSRRRKTVRKIRRAPLNEPITPADSVSIVAIEQLMPRPHRCSKGEACPTYQKREKLRKRIEKEMAISPTGGGGKIILTGDFEGGFEGQVEIGEGGGLRNAEPSYIASSDLLGGAAQTPDFREKDMQTKRDKQQHQNTVKQYLTLQHMQVLSPSDEPPTPPLETPFFKNVREDIQTPRFGTSVGDITIPPMPTPLANLGQLPRLTIPRSASAGGVRAPAKSPRPRTSTGAAPSPRHSTGHRLSTASSTSSNRSSIYRVGTPASMNDMPMSSTSMTSLTPIKRDQSNSVPPNMRFRPQVKNRGSKDPSTWQRASMKYPLPLIPEYTHGFGIGSGTADLITPTKSPMRANPRILYGANTSYTGFARKRRTRFLKHEWTEQHLRLKGNTLAMHASALPSDREALESINIDDFSVVCASYSTDSKLGAALKALKISSDSKGKKTLAKEEAAYVFQLIPETERSKVLKVLKDLKTHHFAVKSQDERIEWVREVMLAKAKKQKETTGYNITINGEEV